MPRVLLAEDMHMVRGALVALLSDEPDITVVADVCDGDAAVPAALEHRPDVAVLDFDLPGRDGLDVAGELLERLPGCRVMILTGIGRPGILRRALAAGVAGFLLKDAPPDRLAESIRRVHAGERVIDPALAAAALNLPPCPLTARETDVVRLLAEGLEARQIAKRLHLATGTVRNYLTSALLKLGARNQVDAVRIAQAADWV
ncbi:response regulator transcription factor [Yinghuangia seranimata]|uniref:response regulator transcription factor n=1 Tax=Yinghuangia seranimata TaxID=408067 RepID=UPI00248AFDBF|nr:response regulator transcription factor [Yinghuangia seranimata]MDI2129875.1 response regulator transcription factor [Yinghuangia seranimata]